MQWDLWWQGEGSERTLDRPLLHAFSSMFSGKGLPEKKVVEAYLQWDIWWRKEGKVRTLDRELLRTFSSMFSGRGLPSKKTVDDYLKWQLWWQGEGSERTLDRELLRAFSSMFNSRGLPDKEVVDNYLQLDIWWHRKGEVRTLDRELLCICAVMFHGRGLPNKKAIDDYLHLPVWRRREGKTHILDRELLRVFSSMFRGRGLPNIQAVENYLKWELWRWEGDGGRLDRELLHTFSSMFSGKGLPGTEVSNYLTWEVWWQNKDGASTLDHELLRTFSAMFSGKELPDKKAVDNYLKWELWWRKEGDARTLDRKLLRTFSSMFHGRGFPDKKAVDDYLLWDIWWQGKGDARTLDRQLLATFSSMFQGRGLPKKSAVEDYLQWELWQQGEGDRRTLDRELLSDFSLMLNGKGLPDKLDTDEVLQWLAWNEQWGRQAIKVMANLYSGSHTGHGSLGLPDLNKLREAEQKLTALIPLAPGECNKDQEQEMLSLIKMVALYLANDGGTRQLLWTDCEAWFRQHPRAISNISLLKRLLLTLHYHGGRGIREAVALIAKKTTGTKWFVLDALVSGTTLASVQYALQTIEPAEWRQYLFFTRGLQLVPFDQQWQTIKGYREALAPVLPNQEYQRQYLNLLWTFSRADRERFVQPEAVGKLVTLLSSIQVMGNLSKSLTTAELKTLFDTCLAYGAGQPDQPDQQRGLPILFKALLLAQLPLLDGKPIIPGVLASTYDQPEGVVVRDNPAIGVVDSVSLCTQVIATLTEGLRHCKYTVNGQTLTLWPQGATAPITFPTPSLAWHQDGVQIRHWSSSHLHRFYQATECWQGLYQDLGGASDHVPGAAAFLTESRDGHQSTDLEQSMVSPVVCLNSSPSQTTWLDAVLKQSVLSQADIERLYPCRDQLTSDHIVGILLKIGQGISQDTVQQWQLLLGEKHDQDVKTNPPWLDSGDNTMDAVRDVDEVLRDLFPDGWLSDSF